MSEDTKGLQLEKQELTLAEGSERTRECRCFIPRTDIFETGDRIVVVADVPGVSPESLDVTLEKNMLTINGLVEPLEVEGYALGWAEYEYGDYQRSFSLSDEIDREGIEAVIKDGVLRLYLPKSGAAKTRKIPVTTG